ncbi:hypothetical protein A2U01_0115753, partial [Trifolium medium]|nr:hypothetical protein [Trifolium medium]
MLNCMISPVYIKDFPIVAMGGRSMGFRELWTTGADEDSIDGVWGL